MAFKIVNGKLVRITSQSDFGTPEQREAGRRITGTLGNITRSPSRPRKTSTPQKITLGSDAPRVPAPVVPTISAGSNTQQVIQQQAAQNQQSPLQQALAASPIQFGLQAAPVSLGPPSPAAPAAPGSAPAPVIPQSRVDEGAFLRQQRDAGVTGIPTGTLGLGRPDIGQGTTFGQGPNQIVTGQDLRFRTLNNPRTLGEFISIGAAPSLQAQLDALLRGEEIHPAFTRFFLNQGLIEEKDGLFDLPFDSSGIGAGGGGGGGGFGPIQFPGGRIPGARSISLGLTNWRI